MRPPDFPAVVPGLVGPIRVEIVDQLEQDGEANHGQADFDARRILLKRLPSPVAMQVALEHERYHFRLWDLGLHFQLTEKQREALCDGLAACRVAEAATSPPPTPPG